MTVEIARRSNGLVRKPALRPISRGTAYYRWRRILDHVDRWIPGHLHVRRAERQRAVIAARVGDAFRDSNRRLAEMIGIDLERFGYLC